LKLAISFDDVRVCGQIVQSSPFSVHLHFVLSLWQTAAKRCSQGVSDMLQKFKAPNAGGEGGKAKT